MFELLITLGIQPPQPYNMFDTQLEWLGMVFLVLLFFKTFVNSHIVSKRLKTDNLLLGKSFDAKSFQLECLLIFYWKRTHNMRSRKLVNICFFLMILILLIIAVLNLINLMHK